MKPHKDDIFATIRQAGSSISLPELLEAIDYTIAERTLRRWLASWVQAGELIKTGKRRSTRYRLPDSAAKPAFQFLQGLSPSRKDALLNQIRDLWTHHSTAVEGNTLTLGDTHFVLEQGLTISGKPIKDHQEVIGHSRAIDILYRSIAQPTTAAITFELHKAIQTQVVTDICKPNGAWKVEQNGTYVVTRDNQQAYINYAAPSEVPYLMDEILGEINAVDESTLTLDTAPYVYAKVHAGIAHTHPFWDGNGRIARLIANIPLLRAGLPPIVITVEQRQAYIQTLAEYEIESGTIDRHKGAWPNLALLTEFEAFCAACYESTKTLILDAHNDS